MKSAARVENYDVLENDPEEKRAIFRAEWEAGRTAKTRPRQLLEAERKTDLVLSFVGEDEGAAIRAELARLRALLGEKSKFGPEVDELNKVLFNSIDRALERRGAESRSESDPSEIVRRLANSYVRTTAPPLPPFVDIKPGRFLMGTPPTEAERGEDEVLHSALLTRGYAIATTEVTQRLWHHVMGTNPAYFSQKVHCPVDHQEVDGIGVCPNLPVERVSWEEIQDFLTALNRLAADGQKYRLPTEAEWEYAARAGTGTAFSFGDDASELPRYGWHWANSGGQPHPVATLKPNPWGLFDVHGNVWEWVRDAHEPSSGADQVDPMGPVSGENRVCKGGCWYCNPRGLRSGYRGWGPREGHSDVVGFRLAR